MGYFSEKGMFIGYQLIGKQRFDSMTAKHAWGQTDRMQ
jgi:hypothetical protein